MQFTFGKYFKIRREELKKTLEEISADLYIQKDILEKIEKDKLLEIGPIVYVKGFVKNYAKYLELNTEEILKIFNRIIQHLENEKHLNQISSNKNTQDFKQEIKLNKPNININGKLDIFKEKITILNTKISIFKILMFTCIILVIGIFIFNLIQNINQKPKLKIYSPTFAESDNAVDFVYNDKIIIVTGESEADTEVYVDNQKVTLTPDYFFRSPQIAFLEDTKTILIKAKNRFGATSEIKLNLKKNITENQREAKKIILEILPDTFAYLMVDDIVILNEYLKNTYSRLITINKDLYLEVGDKNNVRIEELDGTKIELDENNTLKIFNLK